ncbi:MAG: hypothetical protein IJD97_01825 [Clostridia bacterium]|nr:hypothetical protein [Clostridia bacterium]MBQ2940953.1 hypothetical protein [Clostridia bacterium]
MSFKEFVSKEIAKKSGYIILLLMVAVLSMTVISKIATSPESYKSTIQSIDEKKAIVMGVTATTAATSTALAAIPGDATTPIANQIMELSSYLLIVVCALVLEKSLLTVMGCLSFNLLIPISCVMFGLYTFIKKRTLKILALKFIVFALVIVSIIPFSMKISDMIYEANQSTVEHVVTDLEESVVENGEEEKYWIDKMLDNIKDNVSDVGEKAKQILNSFIDAIALFIITYCALPIIIVFFVIWFINFLFKINIPMPNLNTKQIIAKHEQKAKIKIEEKIETEEKELIKA